MMFVDQIVEIGRADFASSPTLEARFENPKRLRELSFVRERQELGYLFPLFLREFCHDLYSTACPLARREAPRQRFEFSGPGPRPPRTRVRWNEVLGAR